MPLSMPEMPIRSRLYIRTTLSVCQPISRPTFGAEAIRATFEEEFAGTNFTEEGPVHCLEVAGDWAHAWGTWSQTGTDATGNAVEESGKWLEILKRTPEGWKIYIEIWNRG